MSLRVAIFLFLALALVAVFPKSHAGEAAVSLRLLILAQKPARAIKLQQMVESGRSAGVKVEYRSYVQGETTIKVSALASYDVLLIDSPYASRLAGVMQELDAVLREWGRPVLFMPRNGYVPARQLSEAQGKRLAAYYQNGGARNRRHFFDFLKAVLAGRPTDPIPPPLLLPDAGIYHPDHEAVFSDNHAWQQWQSGRSEDFLRAGPPVVGIAVHRSYLVDGELAHIDATVRAVERAGAVALVWYHPARDTAAMKRLLMRDGKPIVDVIIHYRAVFDAGASRKAFALLDVPVLQALLTRQTAAQWQDDPAGWPFSRIPFYIAQPESAGIIDPTVVAATDHGKAVPMMAQLDNLVARALRQAALRRLPNRRKRWRSFTTTAHPAVRT
jgi:cobaltochelatase CobN